MEEKIYLVLISIFDKENIDYLQLKLDTRLT